MQPVYAVEPLRPADVDRAYPLVCPHLPGFDLAAWRSLCRDATTGPGERREILVACDPAGYLRGLCVLVFPADAAVAEVALLAFGSVADEPAVAEALLARVVERARERGCQSWRVAGAAGPAEPAAQNGAGAPAGRLRPGSFP